MHFSSSSALVAVVCGSGASFSEHQAYNANGPVVSVLPKPDSMKRLYQTFPMWLTLVLGLQTSPSLADGVEQLLAFQHDVQTLAAGFKQMVTDENGQLMQTSSGSLVLARPNRFRWDYLAPYEQLIVSDGATAWFFDADLEQVTVKSIDGAVDGTAALLLSAGTAVEDEFRLSADGIRAGVEWVSARPRQAHSSFDTIRIGFRGNRPVAMELIDSFGQLTSLEFSNVRLNPTVAAERFEFVPPPGVDVLRSGD